MTRALVPLADGVEEMEAVILIDTLRRAGWQVVSAAITGLTVKASRGVHLVADLAWGAADVDGFDVLALPGGAEGTSALMGDARVLEAVRRFVKAGKRVAAICAAPLVLQAAGVLAGCRATCHPGVRHKLHATAWQPDRVVTDGCITTSQGPGTAFEFALELIRLYDGAEKAAEVGRGMVL